MFFPLPSAIFDKIGIYATNKSRQPFQKLPQERDVDRKAGGQIKSKTKKKIC